MYNVSFLGKRQDKNTVDQLRKQGDALTLNNQRNITNAISKLSEDSSEDNIKFLMNVAQGLRYGTSFELDNKKTNNDWKGKLQEATAKALANSDSPNKAELEKQFKETFIEKKELTKDEKAVLDLRTKLLQTKGLPQAMNNSDNEAVKNIAKNLDYFVISSEVTTKEKKSCLEKLNKLMSPEYKINYQLTRKKPQVLGELLNDLVVKTADSDKPTIKTTDQRHHGMCAAISTSRKVMAYEYKDKYVSMIMEELNDKNEMKVYDPTKLGTNAKISVPKTHIDFNYADDKGYRILDASALQWMNIAGNSGDGSIQSTHFSAFDRYYFDTFHDGHYLRDFDNPKLVLHQNHLRALEKAEDFISTAKKGIEKREKEALEQRQSARFDAQTVVKANKALTNNLKALMPEKSDEDMVKVVNKFLKMGEVKGSQSDDMHFFDYEEEVMKKQKMANFIKAENPSVKQEDIDARMNDIFNMYELSTETTEYMNKEILPKSPKNVMKKHYQPLYEAAASYRTAQQMKLDIPENLEKEKKRYGLADSATRSDVMKKYENEGKVVSFEVLKSMQQKYNKIAKYAAVVEKAEVKGDKLNMDDLYNMTPAEKEALDKFAKNLNKIHTEIKKETAEKQKELEVPLNELAKEVGKEKGSFWVSKEGSSGLVTPQEVRILEQMTGKPYYTEKSVEVTAEKIKKGPHSGISNTSVYHNERGGHAQYIADVAPLLVKNANGEFEVKDAIMHDNTWGACEHKKTWLDSKGLLRTDYQCGRGGKDGYITNSAWQNGVLVDEFKYEPGTCNGEKMKMFFDAILPTTKNDMSSTATNLVQQAYVGPLLEMSKVANVINSVKTIPAEDLSKVMERAENAGETKAALEKQVYSEIEAINSEADLAKASNKTQNYMKKLSDELTFSRDHATKAIKNALSMEVNAKNIDKIEDKDFQVLKNYIDTEFDPKSNTEFMAKFREMKKAMDNNSIDESLAKASDKALSVKTITPYEAVRLVKGMESNATKELGSMLFMDSLQDNIKLTPEGNSFEESYFILKRDWDNLSTSKELAKLKNKMFQQYGVRSAYPECSLTTKEETNGLAKTFADTFSEAINVIGALKQMKDGKMDKQGLTDEQISLAMKNQLNDLNEGKKTFIEMNVIPKHRNVVMKDLNNYISAAAKNKDVDKAFDKFSESFSKNHVLNNPNDLLKEYIRLVRSDNKKDAEMASIYEGYVVKGCYELAKFDTAVTMMSEASNGHMHEVFSDLSKISTPKEWDDNKDHDLSTDEGLYSFIDKFQDNCGLENTLTLLNHIGKNDKAMQLEMDHIGDIDELVKSMSKDNIQETVNYIQKKANFVSKLNLKNHPKEQSMQALYIAKIVDAVNKINDFSQQLVNEAMNAAANDEQLETV